MSYQVKSTDDKQYNINRTCVPATEMLALKERYGKSLIDLKEGPDGGKVENYMSHCHFPLCKLRFRDSNLTSISCYECTEEYSDCDLDGDKLEESLKIPVDQSGADDGLIQLVQAIQSEHVRLLWLPPSSSSASPSLSYQPPPNERNRSNPGPIRRPFAVPWRLRHKNAYATSRSISCKHSVNNNDVPMENVEVRVARIFNTFGPRMHMNDGRVVSIFILQALQNEPITIYGSGDQTRSFQYVSDLVEGLIALMNSNYSQPVNIGNPEEYTIKQFAEIIKKMVGGTSKIVLKPAMEDDPRRRKPDISQAKKYLNCQPQVTMYSGLNKTAEYFRQELRRKHHSERNVWMPEARDL